MNNIKKVLLVNLIVLVFFKGTVAQEKNDCSCSENFNVMVKKIEDNYAGFPAKIKRVGEEPYRLFVDSLKAHANASKDLRTCFHTFKRYINYFGDAHLAIYYPSTERLGIENSKLSEVELNRMVQDASPKSLEGIWMLADSTLTMAIIKEEQNSKVYKGIVIESKRPYAPKGIVFYTIFQKGEAYLVEPFNFLNSQDMVGKKNGNLFQVASMDLWFRTFPAKIKEEEKLQVKKWKESQKNPLEFKVLNDNISYLKVGTFNSDAQLTKLVSDNDSIIRKNPYLIIDLRGNGGGSTGWINFLPYLNTHSFNQGISYTRISDDNMGPLKNSLDLIANKPLDEEMKKYFREEDVQKKKQEFTSLENFKGEFFPVQALNIRFDSVLPYPKAVAIIVDRGSGSSSEYFLYLSKQSTKVTSYGENTMGIMDYMGAEGPTQLPCKDMYFMIPSKKSEWTDTTPTNLIGFKPDVVIKKDKDKWLDFVIKNLKKQ